MLSEHPESEAKATVDEACDVLEVETGLGLLPLEHHPVVPVGLAYLLANGLLNLLVLRALQFVY